MNIGLGCSHASIVGHRDFGDNAPPLATGLAVCRDCASVVYVPALRTPAPDQAASADEGGARRPVCWHRNVTTYEEGSACNDCGGAIVENEWHRMHGPRAPAPAPSTGEGVRSDGSATKGEE